MSVSSWDDSVNVDDVDAVLPGGKGKRKKRQKRLGQNTPSGCDRRGVLDEELQSLSLDEPSAAPAPGSRLNSIVCSPTPRSRCKLLAELGLVSTGLCLGAGGFVLLLQRILGDPMSEPPHAHEQTWASSPPSMQAAMRGGGAAGNGAERGALKPPPTNTTPSPTTPAAAASSVTRNTAAPPAPPSPPPPPSWPPGLPPPITDYWAVHEEMNCWWDGHGAEEVDEPKGTPVEGVQTLDACLRSCTAVPAYGCDGVLWKSDDSTCYRKRNIVVPDCSSYSNFDRDFDLYVRTDEYLPLPPYPPSPPALPPSLPWPPASPPPDTLLRHDKCVALWENPHSRFHDLWGMQGWKVRSKANPACWGKTGGAKYFDDAWWGRACETRNWYTGTPGELGDSKRLGPADDSVHPHFHKLAPALLGFDESIDNYCASHGGQDWMGHSEACVHANVNILSLYGKKVPYNICRNVEWQLCAAKGTLPGQAGEWLEQGRLRAGRKIRFAFPPGELEPTGNFKPLGACEGYMPEGCGNRGYASSDSAQPCPAALHSALALPMPAPPAGLGLPIARRLGRALSRASSPARLQPTKNSPPPHGSFLHGGVHLRPGLCQQQGILGAAAG